MRELGALLWIRRSVSWAEMCYNGRLLAFSGSSRWFCFFFQHPPTIVCRVAGQSKWNSFSVKSLSLSPATVLESYTFSRITFSESNNSVHLLSGRRTIYFYDPRHIAIYSRDRRTVWMCEMQRALVCRFWIGHSHGNGLALDENILITMRGSPLCARKNVACQMQSPWFSHTHTRFCSHTCWHTHHPHPTRCTCGYFRRKDIAWICLLKTKLPSQCSP